MSDDLKRCPFDGTIAIIDSGLARKDGGPCRSLTPERVAYAFVRCPLCGIEKGVIRDDQDETSARIEVARQWNLRDEMKGLDSAQVSAAELAQDRPTFGVATPPGIRIECRFAVILRDYPIGRLTAVRGALIDIAGWKEDDAEWILTNKPCYFLQSSIVEALNTTADMMRKSGAVVEVVDMKSGRSL